MAVMNYRTRVDADKTKGEIVALLTKHGVNNIMLTNEPDGIRFEFKGYWYQLPA
ncbi:hypothetical protein PT279_09110 [Bifidobacterium sp. ESL0784]|uniref:hypothetical protein n=1 Tax=Bifidobacterium sp. ESL0784 TaxID=2983231 RepID=UPI0023F76D8B|nr:hypothetical protein [Bifidobacterium sp. ESL0784]MDF7641741.1 hypothetical protein [Bifidobacterium sp. ESL0784]